MSQLLGHLDFYFLLSRNTFRTLLSNHFQNRKYGRFLIFYKMNLLSCYKVIRFEQLQLQQY